MPIYNNYIYNKVYDDIRLKKLEDIPCVYLIHVRDSLYKFGRTKHPYNRMNNHKKLLSYKHIRQMYELPNLDMAIILENKIKKYTVNNRIRRYIERGNEFFEINNDYPIEKIISDIDSIFRSEMLIYNKYNVLLNIDREKTKQAELEIETRQIELEILRLRENNTQPPQQPAQPPKQSSQPNRESKYIRKVKPKTKKCQDCDTMIIDKSTRCYQCVSKYKLTTAIAQSNRPTLEQLEEELKTNTYINLGKKYGVSDNTIRSWIKQYKKHII